MVPLEKISVNSAPHRCTTLFSLFRDQKLTARHLISAPSKNIQNPIRHITVGAVADDFTGITTHRIPYLAKVNIRMLNSVRRHPRPKIITPKKHPPVKIIVDKIQTEIRL
mmetsp:Transcript_56309/g.67485  ORF Transcript_56309/g.67485 Transcript_56309/m.67485 type:complete len:110 (-) Transcript_56309:126-455(-)